ncbi:c-type cytochrome [Nitrospina watsonii]|uniref:Triheme cytochrome c n=1 Tax=Nitrospina watsonii TaxID=1323948 RepID=A0ABM9HE79_9BACT|nr:c-type cytochrome [Nitrospina watsonii]CAI2718533.1 Putative Triheme cytochrome c [Nitrospina watsonii]
MSQKLKILFAAVLMWGLPATGWPNEVGRLEDQFKALIQKGRALYLHYCAHCHGLTGNGDGYNADHLDKSPAELSNPEFTKKKSNEQIFRAIKLGGAGVRKSHLMPAFGRTLSEAETWSLVAYIRFLGRDHDQPVFLPEDVKRGRPHTPTLEPGVMEAFRKWHHEKGDDPKVLGDGRWLFREKKSCFACHTVNGEGGEVGPDLSRAGFMFTPGWIYSWIRSPQRVKPQTKMPTIGLDDTESRLITAYLSNLGEVKRPADWEPYLKAGGDADNGKKLFFDAKGNAYCSKCHSIQGKGGQVGPDLSYVGVSRTRPFILESILAPKEVITVGYSSVLILTQAGRFLTGVKVNEDDKSIDIINKDGENIHVEKDDIKKFKTQEISIMPGNFGDILSVQEIRDILTYLTSLPPVASEFSAIKR